MSEHRPHTESELIEHIRAIDVRAPEELHRRVQALVAERSSESEGRRRASAWRGVGGLRLGGAIAAALAVTAGLVLALTGSSARIPSLHQASAPALGVATMAAPAESAGGHGTLALAVDGVPFPYWEGRFGWRASGARLDRVDGRTIKTVFYTNTRGRRIGYAILSGTPAPVASGGGVVWRAGTSYRLLDLAGVTSVVWLREGHLCVMSGRGVSSATLLALASWQEHESVS